MDSEQLKVLSGFIQDALQQTLPDINLQAVPDTYNDELVNWSDSILVSIVRFQSEAMSGSAVLGCESSFLARTCPHFDPASPQSDLLLQDWLGELINLVLGRLKNKLLPFGLILKLNPPSVTEAGPAIFETYASYEQQLKLWFAADEDYLCLSFSLILDAGVDLEKPLANIETQLQPGDAIYRLNEPYQAHKTYDMISKVRSGVDLDDESAESDEFDLADEAMTEPEPKPGNYGWKSQLSPRPASDTLLKADFSQGRSPHSRRALLAIRWLDSKEIVLSFEGQVSYILAPQQLLQQGTSLLVVEGLQIKLIQNGQGLQVSIPELQLTLAQGEHAA